VTTLAKQEGGESEITREGGSLTPSRSSKKKEKIKILPQRKFKLFQGRKQQRILKAKGNIFFYFYVFRGKFDRAVVMGKSLNFYIITILYVRINHHNKGCAGYFALNCINKNLG
jgi:hypothetical protein